MEVAGIFAPANWAAGNVSLKAGWARMSVNPKAVTEAAIFLILNFRIVVSFARVARSPAMFLGQGN